MKSLCWLLCVGVVFLTACRRKREAVPDAPAAVAPAAAGQPDAAAIAPAPSTPAPGALPVTASISVQHFNQMSEALLKFRRDKQRGPKNWEELIAAGYLKQMPSPPPGKRYTFDRSLNVQMVNQ